MPQAEGAVERALRSFAAAMLDEIAHELNNRLATMRETVGLLEDLAGAGKAGAAGTARARAALDDQVARTLNVVRALGALGTALGASGGFDAGAAAGDLLGTTERWARRHGLRIEREIADGLPAAAGDPAVFLCLLHRLLARCAGGPADGIALRVTGAGGWITVHVAPTGAQAGGAGTRASVDEEVDRELALRLGGEVTFEEGGAATIRLTPVR